MKYSSLQISRAIIALFFYGSVVGFTSGGGDGEKTWIDIAAGFGSFTQIARDCDRNILHEEAYPFTDGDISIRHDFGKVSVAGRAGRFNVSQHIIYLADTLKNSLPHDYPYSSNYAGISVSLNGPYIQIEAGLLYLEKTKKGYFPNDNSQFQPFGKVRIGFENKWYFTANLLDNGTLFSGGGIFDAGVGFRFSGTNSSLWFGLGEGYSFDHDGSTLELYSPVNETILIARSVIGFQEEVALLIAGKYGLRSTIPEYGFALGLRVRLK